MNKQKIGAIVILIGIIGSIGYLDYHIDKEEGINVYHMKGENFNNSINLGFAQVSPGLNNEIFNLSVAILMILFCTFCFVFGGGLEIFKDDANHAKSEGGSK